MEPRPLLADLGQLVYRVHKTELGRTGRRDHGRRVIADVLLHLADVHHVVLVHVDLSGYHLQYVARLSDREVRVAAEYDLLPSGEVARDPEGREVRLRSTLQDAARDALSVQQLGHHLNDLALQPPSPWIEARVPQVALDEHAVGVDRHVQRLGAHRSEYLAILEVEVLGEGLLDFGYHVIVFQSLL